VKPLSLKLSWMRDRGGFHLFISIILAPGYWDAVWLPALS
jgi:hypothetical protein